MAFTLAPAARAAGYRLVVHDTVGSTSADAMERARAGEAGPLWVVARRQSEGRGRRGSAWHTPPGNLAASLLLTRDLPPATLATLGFVAGVALARALDACCGADRLPSLCEPSERRAPSPGSAAGAPDSTSPRWGEGFALESAVTDTPLPGGERSSAAKRRPGEGAPAHGLLEMAERQSPFTLKWPNDVLAGDAKLAGILLGTEEVAGRRAIVIGIGVNVVAAPDGLPYRATSLHDLGSPIGADTLFEALSGAWVEVAALWDDGRGFEAVRTAWLARAAGLGQPVAVRTGDGLMRGRFETIDGHGQLVVKTMDGTARRVSAGEVHFGAAASAAAEAFL